MATGLDQLINTWPLKEVWWIRYRKKDLIFYYLSFTKHFLFKAAFKAARGPLPHLNLVLTLWLGEGRKKIWRLREVWRLAQGSKDTERWDSRCLITTRPFSSHNQRGGVSWYPASASSENKQCNFSSWLLFHHVKGTVCINIYRPIINSRVPHTGKDTDGPAFLGLMASPKQRIVSIAFTSGQT